jgi:hypothetical protein
MGITSSSPSQEEERQRQRRIQHDIKYLGDRCPFGDTELYHMYETYHTLLMKKVPTTTTTASTMSLTTNKEAAAAAGVAEEQYQHHQQQPSTTTLPLSSSSSTCTSFLTDLGVESYKVALQSKSSKKNNNDKKKKTGSSSVMDPNTAQQHLQAEAQQIQNQLNERQLMLQIIETKILPEGFGNTLYRSCFIRPTIDVSMYDINTTVENAGVNATTTCIDNNSVDYEDEFTRLAKLETFFVGLSDTSRRGPKPALKCLIQCCTKHSHPENGDDGTSATTTPAAGAGYSDFAYGTAAPTTAAAQSSSLIDPLELVTLGYRIGLAAAFLKTVCTNEMQRAAAAAASASDGREKKDDFGEGAAAAADDEQQQNSAEEESEEDEDEEDPFLFLPPPPSQTSTESSSTASSSSSDLTSMIGGSSIKAFAQSLGMVATKRKQRLMMTIPSTATTEPSAFVEEEDVYEWAEYVAPMFALTLSTLMHWIVFPTTNVPSERTMFEYPLALQESVVFETPSSSLLFTFGCLSPALGGEVCLTALSFESGLFLLLFRSGCFRLCMCVRLCT